MSDPGEFGQAVRRGIAAGEAGTLRVIFAALLGVDLDDVRARVNAGDVMLWVEVKR